MKRIVLALLAIVLSVPLGACRGRRLLDTDPGSLARGPTVADHFEAEEESGDEEPAPAPSDDPAEPAAAPEDDPAALIERAREREALEAQQRQLLVDNAIQKAQEALQEGDTAAALAWYDQALQMDPGNEAARRGRNLLAAEGRSSPGSLLEEARRTEVIRRQAAAADVRNYIERGREFEGRENFEAAVKEYQKALAIVSWYTDTRDFGVTADGIRDMIGTARHKAEQFERRERQDQIARAQAVREAELAGERDQRLAKIQSYFEEANRSFMRGEFGLTREYAKQIQRLDPQNCDAEQIIQMAYDAEHLRNIEESRRQFDDQWKWIMSDLEHSMLPQTEPVLYPEDWLDGIAQRKPRIVGEIDDEVDASTAYILTQLESKRVKGLVWEDANLDQIVDYLRITTGLNFFITPIVRQEKFDDVSVSLTLDDVNVKTVLDLVTEPHELRWEPSNGIVRIATADEIRGVMKIRYFDVKDLNVAIQNFVGQEINLVPSNFTPPEPPELPEPTPIFPQDGLVDLIRETIGSEGTWEDPATIEARNGIIIARNTSPVLAQVEALLDDLRANSGILVNLEVRFMSAEDNFLRDVGVDIRGLGDDSQGIGQPGLGTNAPQDDIFFGSAANPYGVPFGVFPEPSSAGTSNDSGIFYNDGGDGAYQARVENLFDVMLGNPDVLTNSGGLSFQHVYLDDTEIEVILRAVQKSERIQQITASRITVYNTQRANVSVLNQVSYVQDYEVEIAQASNIANPVIQTIQDGVVLDVRPIVSADRRFLTLELRPTVALLTRPIATFSTSLASGPITASAPVVIQIPELQVSRVRTTVAMPDGGTLLLGGLKFYEQQTLESGTPIISDIPIIGFLFTRKGNYVNRRNLLILITANIVALDELEPRDDLEVTAPPSRIYTPIRPMEDCAPPPPEPDCGCAPAAPRAVPTGGGAPLVRR